MSSESTQYSVLVRVLGWAVVPVLLLQALFALRAEIRHHPRVPLLLLLLVMTWIVLPLLLLSPLLLLR